MPDQLEGVSDETMQRIAYERAKAARPEPVADLAARAVAEAAGQPVPATGGILASIHRLATFAAAREAREAQERDEREAEHRRRMADDPAYRAEHEAEQKRLRAERLLSAKARLVAGGFPSELVAEAVWGEVPEAIRHALRDLFRDTALPAHLALLGTRGVGKTSAAILTAAEVLLRNPRWAACWVPWGAVVTRSFDPPAEWLTAPLALFDDLGGDAATGPARAILEHVWRERSGNGRLTWLTTNAPSVDALARTVGGPVVDVICDRRKLHALVFPAGPSRRTGATGGRETTR